jgi:TPR repeat protein
VSRSPWAWTKSGYGHLVRAASSLSAPWVATVVMLMLALSPAALGKVASRTRATSERPTTRASHTAGVAHPNSRRSHSRQTPRHVRGPRQTLLTLGSGYSAAMGSPAVRVLQRNLTAAGFSPGPIDGRYGPLTQRAVLRLQAARGLQPDGVAGPHTLAALASAQRLLRPGDGYGDGRSAAVRGLQHELAAAGYSPGPADGRYGQRTRRAVLRFQHARHLAADGVAGPQTLHGLRTSLARRRHRQPNRPASRPHARHHRARPAPARPPAARGTSNSAVPPRSGVRHAGSGHAAGSRHPAGSGHAAGSRHPAGSGHAAGSRHPAGSRHEAGSRPTALIVALLGVVIGGPVIGGLALAIRRRQRRRQRRSAPLAALPQGGSPTAPVRRAASVPQDSDASSPLDLTGAEALRLGRTLADNGDRLGAARAFRRAEEQGEPAAAFELGLLLTLERYRVAAARPSRHPDQRGSRDPKVHIDALRAAAQDAFQRADQRGHPGAACNLGVLLEEQGDLAGATEAYRRADARGHAIGAYNLGTLLERHGDGAAATDAYRRADERGDAMAAHRLGVLLERDGDLSGARDAYRRADQRGYSPGATHPGVLLRHERDQQGPSDQNRTEAEREPDPVARPPEWRGSPAA